MSAPYTIGLCYTCKYRKESIAFITKYKSNGIAYAPRGRITSIPAHAQDPSPRADCMLHEGYGHKNPGTTTLCALYKKCEEEVPASTSELIFKQGDKLKLTEDYRHYFKGWWFTALHGSNPEYETVFVSVRYFKTHHPACGTTAFNMEVDEDGMVTEKTSIPVKYLVLSAS